MHNSSKSIYQNVQGGLKTFYKNKSITSFYLNNEKINYNIPTKLILNVSCNGRTYYEKLIIPPLNKLHKTKKKVYDYYHVQYNRTRILKSYNTTCNLKIGCHSGNLKELYYY